MPFHLPNAEQIAVAPPAPPPQAPKRAPESPEQAQNGTISPPSPPTQAPEPLNPAKSMLSVIRGEPQTTEPIWVTPEQLPPLAHCYQNSFSFDHLVGDHPTSPDGKEVRPIPIGRFDQVLTQTHSRDLYAIMYGVLSRPYDQNTTHDDFDRDTAYRLTTRAPGKLTKVDGHLGVFDHPSQVAGWGIIVECDLKDFYANSTPKGVKVAKMPWTKDRVAQFKQDFAEIAKRFPILAQPTLFFTSRNGFRLVYLFNKPLPVYTPGGLLDRLRGFMMTCYIHGLPVDKSTKDWTRLQRLPMVVREDVDKVSKETRYEKTWDNEFFRMSWGRVDLDASETQAPDEFITYDPLLFADRNDIDIREYSGTAMYNTLMQLSLGHSGIELASGGINITVGDQPELDESLKLIQNDRGKPTETYRQFISHVKKQASHKEATVWTRRATHVLEVLQDGKHFEVNDDGTTNIHDNLYRLAGDVCWMYTDRIGTSAGDFTAQHLYAILLPLAQQANSRRQNSDRTDDQLASEVWRIARDVMRRRLETLEAEKKQAEADRLEAEADEAEEQTNNSDALSIVAQSLQQQLNVNAEWCEEHLRHHLIIHGQGFGYSVAKINDQGVMHYSFPEPSMTNALSHIATSNHTLINLFSFDNDGNPKGIRTAAELMVDYGRTIADNFRLSRLVEYTHLEPTGMEGENEFRMVVKVPGMHKKHQQHPAKFDAEIETWLRALAGGGPSAEAFLDWLACYPDLTKPLQALYIQGGSGIGKTMFTTALTQITETGIAANFTDAASTFQDDFRRTPLLIIDEGSKFSNQYNQTDLSETLRRMIGGASSRVSLKGKANVHLDGYWRLLITANHGNALDCGHDLTQEDIQANQQRVIHVVSDSKTCKDLINQAGGRWGDVNKGTLGTQRGNWIGRIIQHVYWLNENRKPMAGERFAIPELPSEWHEAQRIKSAGGLTICRAIAAMIKEPSMASNTMWIIQPSPRRKIDGVFVSAEEMHSRMGAIFRNDGTVRVPSIQMFMQHLKILSTPAKFYDGVRQRRGLQIDMSAVIRHLHTNELDCDFREALGPMLWDRYTTEALREEYRDLDTLPQQDSTHPDPNMSNVLQFPGTGTSR